MATSVVVVSRGRPGNLALCLGALALQDHPAMEVILVADPAGVAVRPDLPIRRILFDHANIAQARNLGIRAAAGTVVAFIDDDAVAEPGWARRLARAFDAADVIAATGWTRGPHGRRWQVRAEAMTPAGPVRLPVAGSAARLYRPCEGTIISTVGTNCAFRRPALLAVGGFDPAFAYHLDESDLNMRLAARFPQAATVIVPQAQVIHGIAPSERRTGARVPRDLRMIGRSEAIFAARYGGDPARVVAVQRARLIRQMLAGRLDPLRVAPLLVSLRAGLADAGGMAPGEVAPPLMPGRDTSFMRLPTTVRPAVWLGGWLWQADTLRRQAGRAAEAGAVVTLVLLTPGPLPHRTRFVRGGWWEQTGGSLGPSAPDDPALLAMSARTRLTRERKRLIAIRSPSESG